ncbi:MAG: M15 family metallopeptidase [Actinomycetes bacterium]
MSDLNTAEPSAGSRFRAARAARTGTTLVATAALLASTGLLAAGCGEEDTPVPAAHGTPRSAATSPGGQATSPGSPGAGGTREAGESDDGPGTAAAAPSRAAGTATQPVTAAEANPVVRHVPRGQWRRMVEAGMTYDGCPVGRADLRRLEVNYVSFAGEVRRGVLVVHADVAASLSRVFTRLFEEQFPIRRMRPVEAYDGDSNASLRADNTAAYNCRRPTQINAPPKKSPHANGRAIDINPRENPWKDTRCRCWSPSPRYHERVPGKGKILKRGVVWRAFHAEGWIWQDIDVPDYMHFDTGYPSTSFGGSPDH